MVENLLRIPFDDRTGGSWLKNLHKIVKHKKEDAKKAAAAGESTEKDKPVDKPVESVEVEMEEPQEEVVDESSQPDTAEESEEVPTGESSEDLDIPA